MHQLNALVLIFEGQSHREYVLTLSILVQSHRNDEVDCRVRALAALDTLGKSVSPLAIVCPMHYLYSAQLRVVKILCCDLEKIHFFQVFHDILL